MSPLAKAALAKLEEIAKDVELVDGCWIADGDCAEFNYCEKCIDDAVLSRIGEGFPDAIRDGGWTTEHDTPPFCEWCEAKIRYNPTDECSYSELEHFKTYPPDADIGPEEAYDLVAAAENSVSDAEPILVAWATLMGLEPKTEES